MLRILIIDDADDLVDGIADAMIYEGFEVFRAFNGLDGVNAAFENYPDIIVCDINMPEMNGYEVLEELRANSATSNIPFIFLTSKTDPVDIRHGMNLGADDYVTKPFDINDLVTAVRTRLERKFTYELSQLRSFSHQLVTFQEVERQKLAEQLQHELINMLSGLKISLSFLQHDPAHKDTALLPNAINITDEITRHLNDIANTLSPPALHLVGLLPALLWYADNYQNTTNIKVHIEHRNLEQNLGADRRIMVFRIIQEALSNVYRHANTEEVWIKLWVEDNYLNLQIRDEGSGFDIEQAMKKPTSTGLMGIRERANLLNAQLTIRSSPKLGTQIIARFPMDTNTNVASRSAITTTQPYAQPTAPSRWSSPSWNDSIRIIVVEENAHVRWGIRNQIANDQRLELVAETSTANETTALIEQLQPDILVLSMTIPDESSFDLIRRLLSKRPDLRILVMSNASHSAYVRAAMYNGALGYILKTSVQQELNRALLSVAEGNKYINSQISAILHTEDKDHLRMSTTHLDALSTLTQREKEVLQLVLEGLTNLQIAEKLVISPRTAETHRQHMMQKLGLKGRAALMRYAVEKGLIG